MMIRVLVSRDAVLRTLLSNVKAKDPRIGRETARALSRFRVEPARIGLLHLLHHPDRSVVIAAIEGLRAIGTIEEIEHLMAFDRGWFRDRTLRRAARGAIDAIQSRSVGSAGSLSMTEASGSLSLT